MVVGSCYPGMKTSMDFGVLFVPAFQAWRDRHCFSRCSSWIPHRQQGVIHRVATRNCKGGRWLLSRHGDRHRFWILFMGSPERKQYSDGGRWLLSRFGVQKGFSRGLHGKL